MHCENWQELALGARGHQRASVRTRRNATGPLVPFRVDAVRARRVSAEPLLRRTIEKILERDSVVAHEPDLGTWVALPKRREPAHPVAAPALDLHRPGLRSVADDEVHFFARVSPVGDAPR